MCYRPLYKGVKIFQKKSLKNLVFSDLCINFVSKFNGGLEKPPWVEKKGDN